MGHPPREPGAVEDLDPALGAGTRLPWWLLSPTDDLRYRVYARAFAAASVVRLLLPDAMAGEWLGATSLHWLGALLLAVNGCALGWALCALGAFLPLLLLEDQLSQSVYLLACALVSLACLVGDSAWRSRRAAEALPFGVRLVTMSLYGIAGVHKLNRDYFDPAVSCANGGLRLLFEGLFPAGLPPEIATIVGSRAWPVGHMALELTLVLLFALRPSAGVMIAAVIHVPFTLIFAPAFVFVVASGWVCFLSEGELRALGATLRRRWSRIVAAGSFAAALSWIAFFPGRWQTDPDWRIKEVLLWMGLACLLEAFTTNWPATNGARPFRAGRDPVPTLGRVRILTIAGLFLLNGLTPYLGLQFHHSAAMLSNLRIDEGCHNSFVFPEWLRGADPYVRVDRIGFAPGRAAPGYADRVIERLWAPEALHEERRRWCRLHREPLPVEGRYQGRGFDVANLCSADGWPLPEPSLPGLRRFQANLVRSCPQACVH